MPLPDAVVRWQCELCDWDMCVECAEYGPWSSVWVHYDLPPAVGETKADQEQRKQRHKKREEQAIRELDGGAALAFRAQKAAADRERRCVLSDTQTLLARGSSCPLDSWDDFWDHVSAQELGI